MRSRRAIAVALAAAVGMGLALEKAARSEAGPPAPGTVPDPNVTPLPLPESPSNMVVPPARDPGAAAENARHRGPYEPPSGVGVGLSAGGGVADFVGGNIRANTSTAAFWDVRLVAGTRQWVGLETAYVGAAQTIRGLGLNEHGTLLRNGLEGALRVNAPLMARVTLVEPYVFAGAGWNHYSVTSASPTASLRASDDVLTVPFGGGVSAVYRGLLVDARFTYRPTFRESLLHESGNDDLTNWSAGAQVGYEF